MRDVANKMGLELTKAVHEGRFFLSDRGGDEEPFSLAKFVRRVRDPSAE